jgi:hypothetical protein
MNKNLELIAMIYKSVDYLDFIIGELKSPYNRVDEWDIKIRIIANDATTEVLSHLENSDVPFSIYNDPLPNDYYLNRVYRAWNYGGFTSTADNICFMNSDMAVSKDWLKNLLLYHDGINIPCSRLFESGKMLSGTHGVSYPLGKTPKTFNRAAWEDLSEISKIDSIKSGGLYMPCIFTKELFVNSGGYPEGNIYQDGIGTLNGHVIEPGDIYYFNKLQNTYNMKHITVFNSLVYHFQEGEKDE